MTFDDLPDDWPDRPLRDPLLVADVLDLVLKHSDRVHGAIAVLLCDDDARLVQPVVVEEVAEQVSDEERAVALRVFLQAMGHHGALLLAIARRDGLSLTAEDRAWARVAGQVCREGGVELLGCHVVTTTGSRAVPAGAVAA